ncbi:hypothetical protein Q5P01_000849 [Channa striata]|uniref:Uncharacterized protein n=1 Tax=Channa striata TaxID=64152 RepID=A0AA88II84_CHASR|nr:hypothetical protein Q5P01_000849 [Channa striata]
MERGDRGVAERTRVVPQDNRSVDRGRRAQRLLSAHRRVPEELLREREKSPDRAAGRRRKATNLYRRVSTRPRARGVRAPCPAGSLVSAAACVATRGAPRLDLRSPVRRDERKLAEYREEIRARWSSGLAQQARVDARSRGAFPGVSGTGGVLAASPKTAQPHVSPLYPVLAVMELLARNPNPLMASLAERAVPAGLWRATYSRALPQPCSTTRPASAPQRHSQRTLVNAKTGPLKFW